MYAAKSDVRFPPKADMCSAQAQVCFGSKVDIDALWTLVIDRPVSDVAVADRLASVCVGWGRWAGISMHGRTDPTPE